MDVDAGLEFTNAENPYMGTLANFAVDKKIGKGQFSEVYRVRCVWCAHAGLTARRRPCARWTTRSWRSRKCRLALLICLRGDDGGRSSR